MESLIFLNVQVDELKALIQDAVIKVLDERLSAFPPEKKEDQLLKLDEVAKLFGVSKVTIHSWKRNGLLPFYRINSKIYFKRDEVFNSLKEIKRG